MLFEKVRKEGMSFQMSFQMSLQISYCSVEKRTHTKKNLIGSTLPR